MYPQMKELISYFTYYRDTKFAILLQIFVALFTSTLYFIMPWVNKLIYDDLFNSFDKQFLLIVLISLAALVSIVSITRIMSYTIASQIRGKLIRGIRTDVVRKVLTLSNSFYNENDTGDIIQRSVPLVDSLSEVLQRLVVVVTDLFQLSIILLLIYLVDSQVFFIYLTIIFAVFLWSSLIRVPLLQANKKIGEEQGHFYTFLFESFPAIKQIKCFNLYEYQEKGLGERVYSLKSAQTKSTLFMALLEVGGFGALSFSAICLFIFCFFKIKAGAMTIGVFITLVTYSRFIIDLIVSLSNVFSITQAGIVSAQRINYILTESDEETSGVHVSALEKGIAFSEISFRYTPQKLLFDKINLHIDAGKDTAIIGHSGSGKSTITALITGFVVPESGTIRFDGYDMADISVASFRNVASVLSQEPFLFNSSIRENIDPYNMLTLKELESLCETVLLMDLLRKLPEGVETVIGEKGASLSGGERQRICIARILARNSRFIIFDEATSALDPHSERTILKNIRALNSFRDVTTLTITHRPESVLDMDKIIVLNNGCIAEEGTHLSLLEMEGEYCNLFYHGQKNKKNWN